MAEGEKKVAGKGVSLYIDDDDGLLAGKNEDDDDDEDEEEQDEGEASGMVLHGETTCGTGYRAANDRLHRIPSWMNRPAAINKQ